MEDRRTEGGPPRHEMKALGRVAAPVLAALSGGAAAIHFTVVPEHLAESRRIGTFFFVIAGAQAAWALAVLLRPATRRLLLAGAALNGFVALVWVVHNTVGIPFDLAGDHGHGAAAVDVTCTVLEGLVVAAVVAILVVGAGRLVPTTSLVGIAGVLAAGALFASATAVLYGTSHESGTAGHSHDAATAEQTVAPTAAERRVLAQQLTEAREVALRYPTVADAEAAGYHRAGPFSPGAGAHYVLMDGTGTNLDGNIDLQRPLSYLYDGTSQASEVVGVMYYTLAPDAPEGFAGSTDIWHKHSGACLVTNEDGSVESPLPVDQDTSRAMCADAGGEFLDTTGWMLHVWAVPGYDAPDGVFAHDNTLVRCADGRITLEAAVLNLGCPGT
jgi:hypothetical protein